MDKETQTSALPVQKELHPQTASSTVTTLLEIRLSIEFTSCQVSITNTPMETRHNSVHRIWSLLRIFHENSVSGLYNPIAA